MLGHPFFSKIQNSSSWLCSRMLLYFGSIILKYTESTMANHTSKLGTRTELLGLSPTIVYQPASFPAPRFVTERKTPESTFQLTPDFVARACVNFSSLEDKGERFVEEQKKNFEQLNPKIFAEILIKRLYSNLKKRDADINHFVWEFVKHNVEVGAAILKLHG